MPIVSDYFLILTGSILGAIVTLVVQRVLNKRGVLSYVVRHDRVGLSTDDAVFGSVRVLWNENPVQNLFSSTVELTNGSLRDFENVKICVFSTDSILLTEQSELVGSTDFPLYHPEFTQRLQIAPGADATREQLDLHGSRREYLVRTLNRGQVVRFTFLNVPHGQAPTLWLDVVHKGAKLRYQAARQEVLGVPAPLASLVGAITGFFFVAMVLYFVESALWAALLSLIYGFVAQLPGAGLIRLWRWVRRKIGD